MKKKRQNLSAEYEIINQISDIIDAFEIFERLEEDIKLKQINKYISQEMNYYMYIGKRDMYGKFVQINRYYSLYKMYKINNKLPDEYIRATIKFEDQLNSENMDNNSSVNSYIYKKYIVNFDGKMQYLLINPEDDLSYHINELVKLIDIQEIDIAVGFLFSSGLQKIQKSIDRVFLNSGKVKCIIGSLQDYCKASENNKVSVNINNETIKLLNYYSTVDMSLKTLKDRFYHGKIIILRGRKVNCIIMGSSNISQNAFCNNYELNQLIISNKNSNQYLMYFDELWDKCYSIDMINPDIINCVDERKHTNEKITLKQITKEYFENNILSNISDEECLYRFNMWLNRNPDNIYENLNVKSLNNYTAFEYKEYNLIVLDSVCVSNGYYYFYGYDIVQLLKLIRSATKTQIFKLAMMKKRGYHINNQYKLNNNIENIFIK